MEQHPVPQNVTTFQFRLIGDMTLKQFGYLCAGAILAFIAYKLPLPFIITWPLAGLFAFLGIGFAFIPVEERPMDIWVFSFFKSIYSPTQYIWGREPAPVAPKAQKPPAAPPVPTAPPPVSTPSPAPAVTPQVKSALSGIFGSQATIISQTTHTPKAPVSAVGSLFSTTAQGAPPRAPLPSVTGKKPIAPAQTQKEQTPAQTPQEQAALKHKISSLEETLAKLQEQLNTKSTTEQRVLELQQQLTDVLQQKSKTDDELTSLKRSIVTDKSGQPAQEPSTESRGSVHVITTNEAALKAGLPRLTNTPNVITGIVKDDTGNFLPGILITVTNAENVPVRALKTNKLGQFGASTPLGPGVYFVEVEDPRGRFTFSRIQITLNGSVVPVIEIIAKSEKTLTREKLAQEIFGGTKS